MSVQSPAVAADIGAQRIPIAAAPPGEGFPDHALDILAGYLQAFLRRYAGQAWAALTPGTDNDPVKRVFTHDPQEYDFKAADLPALYLFRSGSAKDPENLTADLRLTTTKVAVFWVLPPRQQLKLPAIARAIGRVAQLIDSALRRGRDPSFVVDGDTDTSAALEGSVVIRNAGLMTLQGGAWHAGSIAIKGLTDKDHRTYPALIGQLVISETFEELPDTAVPDELGPTAQIVFPARVSAVITPDGVDTQAVEYRDPLTLVIP